MSSDPGTITALLSQWNDGDEAAFSRLIALAYDDLRAIAHRRLRAGRGDGLATTALVHEAYLKLVGSHGGQWESRAQFFGFASRAMRNILVDHARREQAARRGGGVIRISLDEDALAQRDSAGGQDASADVLHVDEALKLLAERNARMSRIVELRFFGGLTVEQVAETLGMSVRTVEREWTRAKAYLLEMLKAQDAD